MIGIQNEKNQFLITVSSLVSFSWDSIDFSVGMDTFNMYRYHRIIQCILYLGEK